MKPGSRAHTVSSFTIIKGAMIEETYAVLAHWDAALSKAENLERLRAENYIGARSAGWMRNVVWVLNRRLDPSGRDQPLVTLARGGCPLEIFRPILLWHITRDEFLVRDVLANWLYPAHTSGAYRVRPSDLYPYLGTIGERGGTTEHAWSGSTMERVATGLLKMAADFGLLRGTVTREFNAYHLPDAAFLYILHALRDATANPRSVIEAADWRMYLMSVADVEAELLRLHQFRKLGYEVAGSIIELALPCANAPAYAARIAEEYAPPRPSAERF